MHERANSLAGSKSRFSSADCRLSVSASSVLTGGFGLSCGGRGGGRLGRSCRSGAETDFRGPCSAGCLAGGPESQPGETRKDNVRQASKANLTTTLLVLVARMLLPFLRTPRGESLALLCRTRTLVACTSTRLAFCFQYAAESRQNHLGLQSSTPDSQAAAPLRGGLDDHARPLAQPPPRRKTRGKPGKPGENLGTLPMFLLGNLETWGRYPCFWSPFATLRSGASGKPGGNLETWGRYPCFWSPFGMPMPPATIRCNNSPSTHRVPVPGAPRRTRGRRSCRRSIQRAISGTWPRG